MPRKLKSSRNFSDRPLRSRVAVGAEHHRLDLAPESPATREIRSQERVRWGFRLGVGALVVCSLIALGRATVREAFEKNPRFTLREVVVNTAGALTPQKIVKTAGLTDGQNLLSINLREVRERIERLPEVRSGSIRRDFAGKLTIAVEQRRPVAWLESQKLKLRPMCNEGALLVDKDGVALPCEVLVKEVLSLPVIRIERLDHATAGEKVESPQLHAALRLVAEMKRRSTGEKQQVSRIEILSDFALQTKFADGVEATFGMDGLELQLARYARVRSEAAARGWQIATLNLLAQDNVPVTFRNMAALAYDSAEHATLGHAEDRGPSRRH